MIVSTDVQAKAVRIMMWASMCVELAAEEVRMTSQFGWMDHDETQRRRMLAAIELFKEDSTVDELGVGAVRDTIAGALFPGVSVLHTRARYLLFVPWCALRAAESAHHSAAAISDLRRVEVKLIHALLAGGDQEGLIGRVARDKIKRLPSAAYWSVLGRWGIRRSDLTIEGFFRDAATVRRAATRAPRSEEDRETAAAAIIGFDHSLPDPPAELLDQADFTLRPQEAGYLADQWRMTAKGSLLSWVLDVGTGGDTADIWSHPLLDSAPNDLRSLVEHGRRFSILMHGAALLYNLMLAQSVEDGDDGGKIDEYRGRLAEWHDEAEQSDALSLWNRDEFWPTVRLRNPALKRNTEVFVEAWIERARDAADLAGDPSARELINRREWALKGGRARLRNRAALNQWKGASGLVRLDYNWRVTRRLAGDILAAAGGA